MSKKTPTSTVFSQRPDPPNVEEILADVEVAGADDVIFVSSAKPLRDADSSVTSESFASEDSPSGQEKKISDEDRDSSMATHRAAENDIDTVYQQALQLIETTESLKSVPKDFAAMAAKLQKLAADMMDSTEKLKRQSDAVMKATLS